MATNGIVSVIQGKHVAMKVVAGCEGMNAKVLERHLRVRREIPSPDVVYEIAKMVGFGCTGCLVVMTRDGAIFKGEDDLHPRYRETFGQRRFNPRWECGEAPYVKVIRWPSKKKT